MGRSTHIKYKISEAIFFCFNKDYITKLKNTHVA